MEFNDRRNSAGKQKAVKKLTKSDLPGSGTINNGNLKLKLNSDFAEFTPVNTMRVRGNNRDIAKGNAKIGNTKDVKNMGTGLATKLQQQKVLKKIQKLGK